MFKIVRSQLLLKKNIVDESVIGFTEDEEAAKKYCEDHNAIDKYLFPKTLGRYHYTYIKFDYTDITNDNLVILVTLTKVRGDIKNEDEYGFKLHDRYWINLYIQSIICNEDTDLESIHYNEDTIKFYISPNEGESVSDFHKRLHETSIKFANDFWPI